MTDRTPSSDDATLKLGLLMESAQTHQKLAETHLEQLRVHTRDLDGVVRDEIRRTLVEELAELVSETARATASLRRLQHSGRLRGLSWAAGTAMLATAIPALYLRWEIPSAGEIAALKVRRDQLQMNVERLEQSGGRVEWRRCGEGARLCIRIKKSAPQYGEKGDYLIVKGY